MNFVNISENTFKEFKQLLADNDIDKNIIRINLAGMGWGGPSFNIVLDEQKEDDISCTINDLTFIMKKELYDQFGEFLVEGTAENNKGLVLKPVNSPSGGGCGGCGGGC